MSETLFTLIKGGGIAEMGMFGKTRSPEWAVWYVAYDCLTLVLHLGDQ